MKTYRRKDVQHIQHIVDVQIHRHNKPIQQLNEMALPLKEYTKRIEDLMYQLAENWCLCKWCQLFDQSNQSFTHWKEELGAYLKRLSAPKLKNNIGKKKHLEKYLVDWYDLDEKDMVLSVIDYKFDKEQIMDNAQRDAAASAFADSIHLLIDAISNGPTACKAYLVAEFALA